jgi:CubicO group peptidase (beta-lactamase class C family)
MLADEGKLSTDEKIVDTLRNELIENMDIKWNDVTVDMVMRHSFGIEHGFLDIDAEDINDFEVKYGSRTDYLKNIFSAKLPKALGIESCYSDAAYYLLSRVVAKKAGIDLYDYLRGKLFNVMQFEEVAWSKCPMGYSMGATGLYIRSVDIAKLGQLYLDRGVFQGKLILSEDFCHTVLERGYELHGDNGIYAKGGMLGQIVYIDESRKLTVAWQGVDVSGYQNKMICFLKSI